MGQDLFGVLVQYPATDGRIVDYAALAERAHAGGALFVVAADLLALTLLRPPGEFGADICVGSSQRFGVPLGYGGPHAAFLSTRDEYKRQMPGRIVGVSKDRHGNPALRLALQTREQHIRRDKATSNICTAQVLLAVMASMYAVYHGPDGLLRDRAPRPPPDRAPRRRAAPPRPRSGRGSVLRHPARPRGRTRGRDPTRRRARGGSTCATTATDRWGSASTRRRSRRTCGRCWDAFALGRAAGLHGRRAAARAWTRPIAAPFARTSPYLRHEVFNRHHSEHEMLRYIHRLQARDLSLTTSMIPLGSCTMKLNAHLARCCPSPGASSRSCIPSRPPDQAKGYAELFAQLEAWLAEITGFAAMSLQPNAGSQGEYAGLLVIRAYHRSRGDNARDVCLIPVSAHGTNPASAVTAGFKVVVVACDDKGNIDVEDLRRKAAGASRPPGRADGHVSRPPTACSRRRSARSARSCTSTAGRSTWTART